MDYVFSNAGIGEKQSYFAETLDEEGRLAEPSTELIDVEVRGHLNVIKLAWYHMKKQGVKGSIVVTTSGTGLVQWQSLAVYSSVKLAVCEGFLSLSLSFFSPLFYCSVDLEADGGCCFFLVGWRNSVSPIVDDTRWHHH